MTPTTLQFKRLHDMLGKAFYRTPDEKYMVTQLSEKGTYEVWKLKEKPEFRTYIWDGYELEWDGHKRLKDAKEHAQEIEDGKWD